MIRNVVIKCISVTARKVKAHAPEGELVDHSVYDARFVVEKDSNKGKTHFADGTVGEVSMFGIDEPAPKIDVEYLLSVQEIVSEPAKEEAKV